MAVSFCTKGKNTKGSRNLLTWFACRRPGPTTKLRVENNIVFVLALYDLINLDCFYLPERTNTNQQQPNHQFDSGRQDCTHYEHFKHSSGSTQPATQEGPAMFLFWIFSIENKCKPVPTTDTHPCPSPPSSGQEWKMILFLCYRVNKYKQICAKPSQNHKTTEF